MANTRLVIVLRKFPRKSEQVFDLPGLMLYNVFKKGRLNMKITHEIRDQKQRFTLLLHMIGRLIEKGSWFGETHIQKCIYFLQEYYHVPSGYEYILYKHGPFSFELRDELTVMRADGLLSLIPRPPYGYSFLNAFTMLEDTRVFTS